jgi:hypothetical protein
MDRLHYPTEQDDFCRRFQGKIRVKFNWTRFLEGLWPIRQHTIWRPEELTRFYLPWYLSCAQCEVRYDYPSATPLLLADILNWLPSLKARWQLIDQYGRDYTPNGQLVTVEVPVYRLPGEMWLLLDGNHRLSAIALARPAFAATVYEVCGPLAEQALPDLRHWIAVSPLNLRTYSYMRN